jgi:hypothetical protein
MSSKTLDDDDIRDMSIIAVNNLEQQGLIASDIDFDVQDIITESITEVLNRKNKSIYLTYEGDN